MKKSGKSILYLTIVILIIAIIILVGIIIKNSNTNNTISKQGESEGQQLTTTSEDNAYVLMADHLSEISEQQEKLSTLKMVAFSGGAWTNTQTITVPEGVTEGILVAAFGQYDASSYGTGTINLSFTVGTEIQETLCEKSSQYNNAGCKLNIYQCKLTPGATISMSIKKNAYTTNTNKGTTFLLLLSNQGEAVS